GSRSDPLRGHLRLRQRRPVDRHHRRIARAEPGRSHSGDDPRASGTGDRRLRTGASGPDPPLSASGRTAADRLSDRPSPPQSDVSERTTDMKSRKWRTRPAAFFMGNPTPMAQHGAVAVIGLGRFGGALATELAAYGVDVIGIDIAEPVVARPPAKRAFVSRTDATDETVLRQPGIDEASRVVIATGNGPEATILAASKVLKIGNRRIWAKAVSQTHADILGQLGIENVIRPENDMGRRTAHLIRGQMSDFMTVSEDFVLARTAPPVRISDSPLASFDVRR